jgi:Hypothetical protein (DUF2513)
MPNSQCFTPPRRFIGVKRDMDLARDLLRQMEEGDQFDGSGGFGVDSFESSGHSGEELAYHLTLLIDAQLVKGTMTYDVPMVSRLTWEGHEFLANTRDPDVWTTVKQKAQTVAGVGMVMLGELAKAEIKKRLGLP